MQHQQQESRQCMWMERRGLLLGAASVSAALGLAAPNAQVKECQLHCSCWRHTKVFSAQASAVLPSPCWLDMESKGLSVQLWNACDACHAGQQAARSSGPRLGGRGRRPCRPLLPRGALGPATVLLPQQALNNLPWHYPARRACPPGGKNRSSWGCGTWSRCSAP